jgi:hypothetical protein
MPRGDREGYRGGGRARGGFRQRTSHLSQLPTTGTLCTGVYFEVIEIVDGTTPYPTLLSMDWAFDN